jgi:hypothetical protein
MLAVTTPVFRSVVGWTPLTGHVFAPSFASKDSWQLTSHRLVLHTVTEPTAIYLSAWQR